MTQPQRAGATGSEGQSHEEKRSEARPSEKKALRFAVGACVAVVMVPLSLLAGVWVGTLSSNIVLAALPALLIVAVVPPVGVAWVDGRLKPRRVGGGRALALALGAQGGLLVGAIGAGASAHRLGDAVLLTLVEAIILPAAVIAWRPASPPASLPLLVVLGLTLLAVPGRAGAECPERTLWPTREWSTGALPAGREEALKAFEQYAFTLVGEDAERKGVRTDGVVIIYRGRLVYERYARGFRANQRHLGWSMSKSVMNALTGLAVGHGALGLDDSICQHVKATKEAACAITVRHLLEFASGLDWKEGYENGPLQSSSVLAMLYGEGRQDMVGFITSHALRDAPGTSWAYSSGDSTLLAGVVGAAMKRKQEEEGWEWKLLFEPVGVSTATWERDNQGVLVGSSLMYATPRDWAKLGFLFLNDGCWEGQRLLPEGWVTRSVAVSEALKRKRLGWEPGDVQGRQFWLNRRVSGFQEEKPWPHVPEEAFAMRGHWGQSVTIIPSLDLVVVRTADDREPGAFSLDTFLAKAIALVEGAP